jgi:putative FmdB family regulatory protein
MPFYDYACQSCGRRIEVIHGVNAQGPETCEACGGPMRKLLSAPAIVFKGTGWAKKDARAALRSSAQPSGATKDGATGGEGSSKATASEAGGRSGDGSGGGDGSGASGSSDGPSGPPKEASGGTESKRDRPVPTDTPRAASDRKP